MVLIGLVVLSRNYVPLKVGRHNTGTGSHNLRTKSVLETCVDVADRLYNIWRRRTVAAKLQ